MMEKIKVTVLGIIFLVMMVISAQAQPEDVKEFLRQIRGYISLDLSGAEDHEAVGGLRGGKSRNLYCIF